MLTTREAKELRSLRLRPNRDRSGRFLAEGVRVVEDLLASGITVRLLVISSSLEDSPRGRSLVHAAESRGVPHRVLSDREFDTFAATESPQGIMTIAEVPGIRGVGDLSFDTTPALVLVLDAVQDPGNLGTLVRTAEAFGAAGVIALPGTVDPWNPKSVRAAAGSAFRVPIIQSSWGEALAALRSRAVRIFGAASEGGNLPANLPDRVALVVGNEGAGISDSVRADLDALVAVRIRGRAESLNVAAAAAILMYELTG
jgi:RNA methyltransferase, TrmH family